MKRISINVRKPSLRTVRSGNALVSLGLLAAAIVLGGLILSPLTVARVDVTRDRLYTLSPASTRVAASLDGPAVVTLFVTKDLPASLNSIRRQLRDTLEEYRSASRGQIEIVEIDPAQSADARAEAARLQIPEVQFNTRSSDKISVQRGYFGLSLAYREKSNLALPVVMNVASFEYDFTSLLKRATEADAAPRTIRFLTGHGEAPKEQMQALRGALEQSGQVSNLDAAEDLTIPADTSVLVVVGPKEELPEAHLKAIDTYLMGGGKLLLLTSAVTVNQNLEPTSLDTKLPGLLAAYGITLGTGIVGDEESNDLVPFNSGYVQFFDAYPYLVRALGSNADSGSPITRGLDVVGLFWPTAVTVQAPEGATGTTLLSTTASGGFLAGDKPDLRPVSSGGVVQATARGAQGLAVALSGAFPSAYAEGTTSAGGRIVAVGNTDVALDSTIQRYQGNGVFLLNAIDWLVQDEDLIQIRSKSLDARSLEPTTDAQRSWWKWGNILAAPVVLYVVGTIVWFLRRRQLTPGA